MRIPTTRQIAEACGCNQSTVSRVLRHKGKVSPNTRKRIIAIADELGWRPNPMANAYMSHLRSTRKVNYEATLAYLVSFRDAQLFSDYQKKVYEGARTKAESLGYTLEQVWLKDVRFNFARLSRILRSRGIPGIVLTGRDLTIEKLDGFDWNSFAIATWGYSLKLPLHRSAHHDTHGMRLMLNKLRAMGYKRIALILSKDHDELSDHTMMPTFYYDEMHHSRSEWIRSIDFGSWSPNRSTQARIKNWIETRKPEVIIGETVVWQILKDMNWRIPGDVSFASPFWSSEWPDVAGIDQRPEVIGAHAVELLASQLLQNERGLPEIPKMLLSEGRWVDGASVPVLPSAAV